jgi:microcystin-dependent protein
MSQPYVGEIRLFAGSFAPAGWMTCDGQLLPISEYDTLFNLIGTTYGGDGQSTFALPDLTARVPIHAGTNGTSSYTLAENGGVTSVSLSSQQIPAHSHALIASTGAGTTDSPSGALLGTSSSVALYNPSTPNQSLAAGALPVQGGSQPHDNLQPFLALTFIISLFGIYPSPT